MAKTYPVKVIARLPELKQNPALYNMLKAETTITFEEPETFEEAVQIYSKDVALKAMVNELKTNAQDKERKAMQTKLRKKLTQILGGTEIADQIKASISEDAEDDEDE